MGFECGVRERSIIFSRSVVAAFSALLQRAITGMICMQRHHTKANIKNNIFRECRHRFLAIPALNYDGSGGGDGSFFQLSKNGVGVAVVAGRAVYYCRCCSFGCRWLGMGWMMVVVIFIYPHLMPCFLSLSRSQTIHSIHGFCHGPTIHIFPIFINIINLLKL